MKATDRLDEIQARADAATEGPWSVEYDNADDYEAGIDDGDFPTGLHGPKRNIVSGVSDEWIAQFGSHVTEFSEMVEDDVVFIAAARQDVPDLVAALRAVLLRHRDDSRGHCVECSAPADLLSFPCPTVRAVESALGGTR